MQTIESNVSNIKVNPVFNRKPVELLKKRATIGLVGRPRYDIVCLYLA